MTQAAKIELQQQIEDQIEGGTLTFAKLKSAVVKASRKCGNPTSDYLSADQAINHLNDSKFNLTDPAIHTPPQAMAPQQAPEFMINQYAPAQHNRDSYRPDDNKQRQNYGTRQNNDTRYEHNRGNNQYNSNQRQPRQRAVLLLRIEGSCHC